MKSKGAEVTVITSSYDFSGTRCKIVFRALLPEMLKPGLSAELAKELELLVKNHIENYITIYNGK